MKTLKIKRNLEKAIIRIDRIYEEELDENSLEGKIKIDGKLESNYKDEQKNKSNMQKTNITKARKNLYQIFLEINQKCETSEFKDSFIKFISNLIFQLADFKNGIESVNFDDKFIKMADFKFIINEKDHLEQLILKDSSIQSFLSAIDIF